MDIGIRKLTISWEVNDGYVNKSGIQKTTLTEDNLDMDWDEWDELNKEEQRDYIMDAVQDDFDNRITFEIIKQKDEASD